MTSEIVKVLETIIQAINKEYTFEEVEKSVKYLTQKKKSLVAAAYSWVYEKKLRELFQLKQLNQKSSESIRIFSENEISKIGMQNYNYLLHFYNIGLLNNKELESIIDQMMLIPDELKTEDNINLLLLSVILDIDKVSLPGSRYLLYFSDTIN